MVRDDVWAAAGMPPMPDLSLDSFTRWQAYMDQGERFLCVGCLEARLGRELTGADFTDAEVNEPGPQHTPRLNDRLTAAVKNVPATGGAAQQEGTT